MEKRNVDRINGGYETEIIYEGRSYKGIIEDLSETGVSVSTLPVEIEVDFIPGSSVDLKFQPHPGETLV
ncbi:MAG: PilZ domain-containing protein, partial [Nitrospirota bacterium]